MKPESIIMLVLTFSIISICVGGIIGDMNNSYVGINASNSWANKYNYANEINESVTNVINAAEKVGSAKGWLEIGLAGAGAVWEGVKTTITMIISVPSYIIKIIMGVAADIGLPDIVVKLIIPIFIVMVFVTIVFSVVKYAKGEPV